MINGIIIGGLIGLLCGMALMAVSLWKEVDKIWDESYALGFRHGEELERIRQAYARKEEESFGEVKEVKET